MTFLALEHSPDCTGPSTFYEVQGGWSWLACRRCGVTVVRPPKEKETRP